MTTATLKNNTMMIIKKYELLPLIKHYLSDKPTIVEAGAFNGSDTKKLAAFWPEATIHTFEPVPEIFTLLEENTRQIPTIHRYPVALSNTIEKQRFYVSQKPSRPERPFQAGSLHEPHERLQHSDAIYPTTITVQTTTLDAWSHENNVQQVDFLWLDAQGHELAIAQGAPQILKTVQVIYTEVHFIHAYKEQPLYEELKSWIESQGFTMIAKDFTDQQTWFFGNALFVRSK
ncbi:MAG: FkbM family methyltransferase [Candidatus Dependentiae bacterium]|nr:FkbM family methyltransferase [Candidatus Dependentiae bacterium]